MPNIEEETRNRPACFKVVKSASKLLLLEAGSQQSWHGYSSTELVSQEPMCIPSIYLDSQGTEKSRGRESAFSNNGNSNLANPKLVPRIPTCFSEISNHFSIKGRLTEGSSKPISSPYLKSNNAISSVGCLRKRLTKGFRPYCLIKKRRYSLSTYSSAWNKWVSWCVEQNVGPV